MKHNQKHDKRRERQEWQVEPLEKNECPDCHQPMRLEQNIFTGKMELVCINPWCKSVVVAK